MAQFRITLHCDLDRFETPQSPQPCVFLSYILYSKQFSNNQKLSSMSFTLHVVSFQFLHLYIHKLVVSAQQFPQKFHQVEKLQTKIQDNLVAIICNECEKSVFCALCICIQHLKFESNVWLSLRRFNLKPIHT